jgi:hypothetical protein
MLTRSFSHTLNYPDSAVTLHIPGHTKAHSSDLSGIRIHIGTSYHPHDTSIGKMMIDGATTAYANGTGSFKHFIFSSVLNSQLSKMLNHDCKRHIEEWLMESGVPYTILQPSTFMDNIPVAMLAQQEKPIFPALWSTRNRFSMLALSDLAQVFKVVVEERERHFWASYPLTSTQRPVSFDEALGVVSRKIGREVVVERMTFGDAVNALLKRIYKIDDAGLADRRSRDAAERMILFYDRRGLVGSSNVLEWLLGREALQFEGFVDEMVGGSHG